MDLSQQFNGSVTDARLLDIVEWIDRGSFDVLTLDVFDTVLWRKVYEPVDAFVLFGEQLRRDGVIPASMSGDVFAVLRRSAEELARKKHSNQAAPEVTLEEIYERASERIFGGRDAKAMADLETDFERRITFLDFEVASLMRLASGRDVRIALVSDTYFSAAQLHRLVDRPELEGIAFDRFTSSEHRTGKGQDLFKVVLHALAVPPDRVVHLGDHPESDVTAPERFGIRAVHYHKYPGTLAHAMDREIGVREGHIYRKSSRIHPEHGDFGLSAIRAKVTTQYVRDDVDPDLVPYWQLGAAMLGPVFSGYAEWAHDRARDEGVSEIYCLMREGEFLARVLNVTGARIGSPVVAKPLWASRRVCAEASILRADKEELERFVARRKVPTVRDFCGSIGLDARSVPGFEGRADLRLDDKPVARELIETIAGTDDLRDRVVEWSAARRRRFIAQLHRDVDLSASQIIFADLGWGATIQGLIDDALRGEGVDVPSLGLYLVTAEAAAPRMLEGTRVEGFLASAGHPERVGRWITRSPEILEQVCMTDVGSLIGFDDEGDTLHASVTEDPRQARERRAVQEGVLAFDRFWGRHEHLLAPEPILGSAAREALEAILVRLVVEPMPSEAQLLSHWSHDENFGSENSEVIVANEMARFAEHMTPTQFLNLPMTKVYWPFGLAALHNPPLAVAAGAVAAGLAGAGAFESVTGVPVILEIDDGEGRFVEFRRLDARANVNALRYVRTEFLEKARAVRVVFGEGAAAVRLDGLKMSAVLCDGGMWKVDIPAEDGFEAAIVDRGIRLAPNVVIGTHAGPALTFRLPSTVADAYRVELDLAFAILPIPPIGQPLQLAQQIAAKFGRRTRRWAASLAASKRPPLDRSE